MIATRTVVLLAMQALAGCAVGPNFKVPAPPSVDRYTNQPAADSMQNTNAEGFTPQTLDFGAALPAQWWTLYESPAIDALVKEGLRNSPTLAAARATLRSAGQSLAAERGALLPSIDGNVNANRQKTLLNIPELPFPATTYNVFGATVSSTYIFDIWGRERRAVEAQHAQVEYSLFQLEGASLTLASNIVTAALQSASLEAQIAATEEIIAGEEHQLALVKSQFELGAAPKGDVLSAEAQVASDRATLPPLEQRHTQNTIQLAILLGRAPTEMPDARLELDKIALPKHLPVSVPSTLTRRRPDIRSQEALLHAASARIGIATADMLPRITLTGSYGGSSLQASATLDPAANVWNAVGSLTQPLFHGGALLAHKRGAVADFDAAEAQYRDVVLHAFGEVANALTAVTYDSKLLIAQTLARDDARESLDVVEKEYAAGAVNQAALLIAQNQYAQSRIGYIQAVTNRYLDTAALFVALGGGWWDESVHNPSPTAGASSF
jgi:NodT family efflux transporter outer membrane factor (OMF) lipoprotein